MSNDENPGRGEVAHRVVFGAGAVFVVAVLLTVGVASASALGGVTNDQLAVDDRSYPGGIPTPAPPITTAPPTTAPPPTGATDSFDGTGSLQGRHLGDGSTWTVHRGTYTLPGDGSLEAGGATSVATVARPSNVGSVAAVLDQTGGNRSGGPAINVDAAGTRFAAAVTEHPGGGRLRLVLVIDGSVTELASVSQLGLPAEVSIERTSTQWIVRAGGTVVIAHTLTSPQVDLVGANTRSGLFNNANPRPRYRSVTFT